MPLIQIGLTCWCFKDKFHSIFFFLAAFFNPSIFYCCPSGFSPLSAAESEGRLLHRCRGTFHLICIGRDREVHPSLFGAKLWSTFLARHSSLPAAGSLGSLSACQHLELRSKPDATAAAVCASAENLLRQASQSSASLTWRPGTRGAAALCEHVFKWSMRSIPLRLRGQEAE